MKITLIVLLFISTIQSYSISLEEIQDCISKSCDQEITNCSQDSKCVGAKLAYEECFDANRYNVSYPYYECKGVANDVYASLMACYYNCDFNLLLYSSKLMTIFMIIFMIS